MGTDGEQKCTYFLQRISYRCAVQGFSFLFLVTFLAHIQTGGESSISRCDARIRQLGSLKRVRYD